MIRGLSRFLHALRREGVAVSPAEWTEALAALATVGVDERERCRDALRCTLAKRARSFAAFDRAFDSVFASPVGRRAGRGAASPAGGEPGQPAGGAGGGGVRPMGRPAEAHERAGAARRGESTGLRSTPTLLRRLDGLRRGEPRHGGRLRHAVLDGDTRRGPGTQADPRPEPAELRDLAAPMTTEAEREIARQVPRLVRRIRLRSGRRVRRGSRGRLHLRALFRRNAAHGGVPFVLPRERRRRRRSRVVLLVDVSWSAARSAGLFITLAAEFLRRARDVRVLFFVDRPVEATTAVLRWLDRTPHAASAPRPAPRRRAPGDGIVRQGASFLDVLTAVPDLNLSAPSDYGRAFHALLRSPLRPAGRDTVLLLLGDGRTNRFDPQAWALEEIAARCGAVLWLVSEPRVRWGTADSALEAYAEHVDTLVEARNLAGLGRGVSELLRRLR